MLTSRVIVALLAGLCALQFAQATIDFLNLLGGSNVSVCDVCKQVVDQVKSPTNIASMEAVIKKLCHACGTPEASKKCEDKLNGYLKQVDNSSPQQICQAFSMCAANDEAASIDGPSVCQMKAIDLFQGARSGGSPLCNPCKQLVELAKAPTNIGPMKLGADKFCRGSPSPDAKDACKRTFNGYLNILDNSTPKELCSVVSMCP